MPHHKLSAASAASDGVKVWEPLADVLVRATLSPEYPQWARAAALAFQMIYQQPVRYEYHLIAPPTLLIVGAEDHVVPLGQYAQPAEAKRLGDFVELSAAAASDIPNAKHVVVPGWLLLGPRHLSRAADGCAPGVVFVAGGIGGLDPCPCTGGAGKAQRS